MLSRNQFEFLVQLLDSSSTQTQVGKGALSGEKMMGPELEELYNRKMVSEGYITEAGKAALNEYRVQRAIFFAAGFGSRLKPITINTPKPLVRVHGIRIIDRLIDACLRIGIEEIYIVRGYLAEQFDQLKTKYPMVQFVENPMYTEANNISSAVAVKELLQNAYVFEADLLISNPEIIKKYHYASNFLAIKKAKSDDWCFCVENGIIEKETIGGEGENNWQMVGISYWNTNDGKKLSEDLTMAFGREGGKEYYWEQIPLSCCREKYQVEVRPCSEEDIVEIDTFEELKAIDEAYSI